LQIFVAEGYQRPIEVAARVARNGRVKEDHRVVEGRGAYQADAMHGLSRLAPTTSQLFNLDDPAAVRAALADAPRVAELATLLSRRIVDRCGHRTAAVRQ
jgi:hypothetical protein